MKFSKLSKATLKPFKKLFKSSKSKELSKDTAEPQLEPIVVAERVDHVESQGTSPSKAAVQIALHDRLPVPHRPIQQLQPAERRAHISKLPPPPPPPVEYPRIIRQPTHPPHPVSNFAAVKDGLSLRVDSTWIREKAGTRPIGYLPLPYVASLLDAYEDERKRIERENDQYCIAYGLACDERIALEAKIKELRQENRELLKQTYPSRLLKFRPTATADQSPASTLLPAAEIQRPGDTTMPPPGCKIAPKSTKEPSFTSSAPPSPAWSGGSTYSLVYNMPKSPLLQRNPGNSSPSLQQPSTERFESPTTPFSFPTMSVQTGDARVRVNVTPSPRLLGGGHTLTSSPFQLASQSPAAPSACSTPASVYSFESISSTHAAILRARAELDEVLGPIEPEDIYTGLPQKYSKIFRESRRKNRFLLSSESPSSLPTVQEMPA